MATLEEIFTEEIAAVKSFIALLKKEETALTTLTPENLDEVVDEKVRVLKGIEALEKSRAELLTAGVLNDPKLSKLNEELLELARAVQEQNQKNGKRLMRHLERTSEALATLMQTEKPALYGANGQTQQNAVGRNLGSA